MNGQRLRTGILIMLIGSLVVQFQILGPRHLPNAHAVSVSVVLNGLLSGWNGTNPLISVTQGDAVTMTVSSGDVTHRFVIDVDRSGLSFNPACPPDKCSVDLPPTETFSFNVDFPPGNYSYYCTFHPGPMHGTWSVAGFTLSSSLSSMMIDRGSSSTSTIAVTSVNAFSGSVSLSSRVFPSGPNVPNVSINSPAGISPGGAETATLTVLTTGTTATGSYVVTVMGASGALASSTSITVVVAPLEVDGPPFLLPIIAVVVAVAIAAGVVYYLRRRSQGK